MYFAISLDYCRNEDLRENKNRGLKMNKKWRYTLWATFGLSSLLLSSQVLQEFAHADSATELKQEVRDEKSKVTQLEDASQQQVNDWKEHLKETKSAVKPRSNALLFNWENIKYQWSIASIMKGNVPIYRAVDNGDGYQRLEEVTNSQKFLHQTIRVEAIVTIGNQSFYQMKLRSDDTIFYISTSAVQLSQHWGYGVLIPQKDRYATILNQPGSIQSNLDGGWKGEASQYAGKTYKVSGYYELVTDGSRLYQLMDQNNQLFGYAKDNVLQFNDQPWGNKKTLNQYMTVTKKNYKIYQDDKWHSNKNTTQYMNQTLKVKESYRHMNGSTYVTVYDNQNRCLGYVNVDCLQKASSSWGIGFKMEKSVIVNRKDVPAYSAPGKQDGNSSRFYKKNYLVKKYFKAFNGKTYYELFDTDKQKVAGYIEDKATKERPWGFGDAHNKTQYITFMSKNYSMYKDQKFTKKGTTNSYYHKTLKAKSYYKHTNGSTYLSVYDNKNKWVGYVNANAGDLSSKSMGAKISGDEYMGIKKSNYSFWKDLDLKKKSGDTKNYRTTTMKSTGYYSNYNGRKYYSMRTKDKWIGYLNGEALSKTDSWGIAHSSNDYFTVMDDEYNVYSNRNGKKNGLTSKQYHKTYRIKRYYKRYDGLTYYSFYDGKDNWQGYTCSKAGKKTDSRWGSYISAKKSGIVSSANYDIYADKDWKKKCSSSRYYHKDISVKGYYAHYNGSRYYSLNYQNKWVGYINANALSGKMSNQIASNGVYQYVMNIALDVQRQFGGVITSGYRPGSVNELGQADDHSRRCAIDISGVSYGTYEQMKRYVVNKYKNSGLKYVIANNTWAMPSSGWGFVPYPYGGHTNHIHISCNVPSGTTTTF